MYDIALSETPKRKVKTKKRYAGWFTKKRFGLGAGWVGEGGYTFLQYL
jgi:hypothetical protein